MNIYKVTITMLPRKDIYVGAASSASAITTALASLTPSGTPPKAVPTDVASVTCLGPLLVASA